MDIYQRISQSNLKKYGTEYEKVLRIIINQYSDRTHFIYEILQNAEDASARHIHFLLHENALEIRHDGRPFDENDIEGVCGIANGTKEDGTRIGHFGIGFKSVYCYTDLPQIHSGDYHFQIRNRLFPEQAQALEGLPAAETRMILPFDRADVPPRVAFREIQDALTRKITADSILMLNSIEQVDITIDGQQDLITIRKIKNQIAALKQGSVYALGMSTEKTRGGRTSAADVDYLLFSDDQREASALVYRVGGEDGKQLQPIKNARVYAHFPTAKEAHQNFLIHAPFDTTPARDNFKEGAEYGRHNLELIDHICDLIVASLTWLRDNGYLSLSGFHTVFPIYEYEATDLLYGIYENSVAMIGGGMKLLPTNRPGFYEQIENICVPQSGGIVDVFDDADLQNLIGLRKHWIAKEISTEAYSDLRRFLNRNFKLETLDWPMLLPKMTAPFLERKTAAWMESLADRIPSYCIRGSSAVDFSGIPLVRTAEGRHICARDEKGRLQVYLNNHSAARFQIDSRFLSNESIRSLYRDALHIPEYNVEQETIETILPRYQTRKVTRSLSENIQDLKTIKDAVYVNPSILEKLSDYYIVTDGTEWFRPQELYLRSDDVRSGFSLLQGLRNFRYLADAYFDPAAINLKLDEAFFKKIGCSSTIRALHVTRGAYLLAVENYLGKKEADELRRKVFSKKHLSEKLDWAFCFEGFPEIFQNMSLQKSQRLARFLNAHAMQLDLRGELVGADDQNFSGKNVDSAVVYTMLGIYLSYEKWIYIKADEAPHRPVDVDRGDLRQEYQQMKRIMDLLPFREVKNPLIEFLNASISDKHDLELAKRYLTDPKELVKIAAAMQKSEARAEAKKKKAASIEDLIRSGDKKQQPGGEKPDGLEVNPISAAAKKKREENLERQFADSMNQEIYASRGLRFSTQTSNEEERQFLLAEYGGGCQMCGKYILKYDGEPYFEAINMIRFSEMSAHLANSSGLGWNSLCLCPNCAAEYLHCSKKISSIHDQVLGTVVEPDSDEPIGIRIELPEGTRRTIRYSPRHFLALKKAFEIFDRG